MFKLRTLFILLVPITFSCTETREEIPVRKGETVKEPIVITLEEIPEELPPREELVLDMYNVLDEFLEEQNMFDEPVRNTEVGQEDGVLRGKWAKAWRKGGWRYSYRGIWYYTRSKSLKPAPPQVCADFVVDTFDRTGGSWWFKKNGRGYRIDNKSSLSNYIKSKKICGEEHDTECYSRRVIDLITVMLSRPDLFDPIYKEGKDGIVFGRAKDRYETFKKLNVQRGDIVFIYGELPGKGNHWHSFIMYSFDHERNDWEIVGNAAMIAKRWLTTEARRTPRRRVWYVFRPTNSLLLKLKNNESL